MPKRKAIDKVIIVREDVDDDEEGAVSCWATTGEDGEPKRGVDSEGAAFTGVAPSILERVRSEDDILEEMEGLQVGTEYER